MYVPDSLLQGQELDEVYSDVVLLVPKGVHWLLQTDQTVNRVVVQKLQRTKRWNFLMVPFKCRWNGQLDIAWRVQARIHRFFIVLNAFCDCLEVRVVCFEGHPFGWLLLRGQAGLVHSFYQ